MKFVWTRGPANKNDKEENLGARTEGEKRMSQTGDSKMGAYRLEKYSTKETMAIRLTLNHSLPVKEHSAKKVLQTHSNFHRGSYSTRGGYLDTMENTKY